MSKIIPPINIYSPTIFYRFVNSGADPVQRLDIKNVLAVILNAWRIFLLKR
jgi:hypothetical protein